MNVAASVVAKAGLQRSHETAPEDQGKVQPRYSTLIPAIRGKAERPENRLRHYKSSWQTDKTLLKLRCWQLILQASWTYKFLFRIFRTSNQPFKVNKNRLPAQNIS